ncbi:intradiol ring-cleavage dioxygenase [Actinokineospora enzanensis]|uniref:intradiol ring-cleavage dioxygenase n=1 Tax=Actinokineospora enzanensis TaxID=155975 RepID=UPI000382535B|nr:intradiol ring-cleavage dioxygenase [Actinokineospora enzanensis]
MTLHIGPEVGYGGQRRGRMGLAMFDDDEGKRVSRRTWVRGMGLVTLGGLLAACGTDDSDAKATPAGTTTDPATLLASAGTCAMSPATTQGPYYFDADKVRGDVREDRPGTTLGLALKVIDSESCSPITNAVVEIWQCDATGLYSGAEKLSGSGFGNMNAMPGGGMPMPTAMPGGMNPATMDMPDLTPQDATRYLRGAQVTGADGVVRFTTIWPGWYPGRTVHIHVMVHISKAKTLTSQLMFDEKLNTEVFANAPYSSHTGRDTLNGQDLIFKDPMLATVRKDGSAYIAAQTLSVDSNKNGR